MNGRRDIKGGDGVGEQLVCLHARALILEISSAAHPRPWQETQTFACEVETRPLSAFTLVLPFVSKAEEQFAGIETRVWNARK